MKDIGKILLYLVATVLAGALLAPLLFWTAHALAPRLGNQRFAAFVADTNFQRFFNRAILISAIGLLWPLARSLHIRNFRDDLALRSDPQWLRHFFSGFLLALGSLVVLGLVLVGIHLYYIKDAIPWRSIAWLPLTAIVVAALEESLFRGALQGVVQRTATDGYASAFVALLFAAVHFLKPAENAIAASEVNWASGLALVPQAFWQFEQPRLLLGGFTTIFLVGFVLGYARCRTRSLWMPIGLHAGWILGKMSFSKMTKRDGVAWPWFGTDMLIGFGPVILVIITFVIVWSWFWDADTY